VEREQKGVKITLFNTTFYIAGQNMEVRRTSVFRAHVSTVQVKLDQDW
jgi:hypothetical protein